MITFFRKIRQSLLSKNQLGKYLIYAIGEIILVVIGILIALQINNWNSSKKETQLETKMLEEIHTALQSDLADLEYNLNQHNRILNSQNLLLSWLDSDKPFDDSLSFHFFNVINGTNFLSNLGPYETLKGLGVRLIKNDTLRGQILNLYELRYKDYASVLKLINDYRFGIATKENQKHFKMTSPYFPMKPINTKEIKSDNGYTYHLMTLLSYHKYFVEQKLIPTKETLEKTIEQIEQELGFKNKK